MQLLCTIRQSADGSRYEFLVREPSRASITVANERPVLASDLTRITRTLAAFRETLQPSSWNAPSIDERTAALERVGDAIAAYLLPQPVYNLLNDPTLEGAMLSLETNELQIPWEITRVGGRWLWERFLIARQQIFEARREGKTGAWLAPGKSAPRATMRVLIVADPEDSLPTARSEAAQLTEMFERAAGWEVETLIGAQATSEQLVERLQTRPFDVLHLACTAAYDEREPGQSSLFLADEPLPARRLGDVRFCERPRLVFMNACQAAREDGLRPLLSRNSGWGRLFLAAGAEAVIGPLWDVRDSAAIRLSEAFYRALLDGGCVAEALQRGRRACVASQDPYLSAHAYVIYGNPALRLAPAPSQEAVTVDWVLKPRFHLRVVHGPQEGRVIPLLPKTMLEGRRIPIGGPGTRRNDIDLGDEALANEEASLLYSEGAYHLVGETGQARVNGAVLAVGERVRLQGGERLALGTSEVEFLAGPPGEAEAARCVVEVVGGMRFPLPLKNADIGRAADCAVRLDDPAVSRRHATLAPRDDGWALIPRSNNPTLVNGIAIDAPHPLQDGDEIQLSDQTVLRFRVT